MDVTVILNLKPIRTPNYVLSETESSPRQEGLKEAPKFHISELPADAISQLCDKFRADMFEKAGKKDPFG